MENLKIGPTYPPFIIAEMSGNHNHSLDQALKIVEAAAQAGVNALKLQTYTADTMSLNLSKNEFFIKDPNSLWKGTSLYDLYQKAHTPWKWHAPLFKRCRELGLQAFSTPFDASAVDFLENLDVPFYKIASFEITDLALIRKVASTGKPIIISTGMASISELEEAVRVARTAGCKNLILLKCTSAYPAPAELINLKTIGHMREMFHCQVGLSDHTLGIGVAIASIALGATVIEKHFTLSRAQGGVDAAFSLEPSEMKQLVVESKRAWAAIGKVQYGPTKEEEASLQYRRSIYISKNIKKGDRFNSDNLRVIRPGFGLPPKYYDLMIGKKAKMDIKIGTPMAWDLLA